MSETFRRRIDEYTELRLLEEEDVEGLFQLTEANREHLRLWLPWVDETRSREDTLQFVLHNLQQYGCGRGFHVGIWHRDELVGVVGFHPIDWANRSTSLGYWLAESHQKLGLVTRSVSLLVDYAFQDLGLHRVEIRCATRNRRSRAVANRLGFTPEGILRESQWLHDHFEDIVVYGMLAKEWSSAWFRRM